MIDKAELQEQWLDEKVQINIYMPRRDKQLYQDKAHDERRSLAGWVREQMLKGLK